MPETQRHPLRIRVYRLLLRLLPFDFQREYGADMEEVFNEESEALEPDRRSARLSLWYRTTQGIMKISALEQARSVLADFRHSAKVLAKSPGFTALAVLMLAVGIGVNAAAFTVVNAKLFRGFPLVRENSRILYIGTENNGHGCCLSYPDFLDWRAQAKSFDGVGAVADWRVVISGSDGAAERYQATRVSANAFEVLGQKPLLGRNFEPADETEGAQPVAILGYELWERKFAKDASIIGQAVRMNGTPTTIIAVMPEGFSFPQHEDLWVPLTPTPDLQRRGARSLWFAFARMRPGVTAKSAQAEMEIIGRRLAIAYPATNDGWVPGVRDFAEFFSGRNPWEIYGALWGAVALVLMIACANLANLMLARAIGRAREVSLRIALGASRWRVVRQILVDSLMLSAAGGLLGWWIAKWAVRAYQVVANPPTRYWSDHLFDFSLDYQVLAYLCIVTVLTGVFFGLAPALRAAHFDVNAILKEGARGVTGGSRTRRWAAIIVGGEMALAVVLLAAAGVMARSFLQVSRFNIGVQTAGVATFSIDLSQNADKYTTPEMQIAFFDRLMTLLNASPGLSDVSIAETTPTWSTPRAPYELMDRSVADEDHRAQVSTLVIGSLYFRTLGVDVLSGRDFNDFDRDSGMPVAIVNQKFASDNWAGEDPIGKRIRLFNGAAPGPWLTIVGVAPNIIQSDAGLSRQEFDPRVYLPFRQNSLATAWILVRTRIPTGGVGTALRNALRTIDRGLPMPLGPFTLDDRIAAGGYYWSNAIDAALLVLFAAIGLLLACIGLYAVMTHSVGQRTSEIGIRIALGASEREIRVMVLKQGMFPVAIGLAIGLLLSFAVNPVLRSMLIKVSPTDPLTLVGVTVTLILSAAFGCLIPTRRATRVNPIEALRHE